MGCDSLDFEEQLLDSIGLWMLCVENVCCVMMCVVVVVVVVVVSVCVCKRRWSGFDDSLDFGNNYF